MTETPPASPSSPPEPETKELQELPKKSIDLIARCRALGFTPTDIALMGAIADPRVAHKSFKDYQEYLKDQEGIEIDLDRIKALWRNSDFQECVNLLVDQEQGAAIRAVKKTLISRATNPNDPQGIAAAKLVLEIAGELGKNRGGRTSPETSNGGKTISTPQHVDMMARYYEKRGNTTVETVSRRTITVVGQEEDAPPETSPSGPVKPLAIAGAFTVEEAEAEAPDSVEALGFLIREDDPELVDPDYRDDDGIDGDEE